DPSGDGPRREGAAVGDARRPAEPHPLARGERPGSGHLQLNHQGEAPLRPRLRRQRPVLDRPPAGREVLRLVPFHRLSYTTSAAGFRPVYPRISARTYRLNRGENADCRFSQCVRTYFNWKAARIDPSIDT